MTPYELDVNNSFIRALGSFGVEDTYSDRMSLHTDYDIAHATPDEIRAFTRRHMDRIPKGVFCSCASLRSSKIIDELSGMVGLSVVTSNHSVIDCINSL